jgi:hypothetical protein
MTICFRMKKISMDASVLLWRAINFIFTFSNYFLGLRCTLIFQGGGLVATFFFFFISKFSLIESVRRF